MDGSSSRRRTEMAHGITAQDGMYTVRQPAWHRLGVVLPEYPTREEAQALSMPWEPVTTPLFTEELNVDPEAGPMTDFEEVPGFVAVQRSDTSATIGVVSDTYQPVSNTEMWDIA